MQEHITVNTHMHEEMKAMAWKTASRLPEDRSDKLRIA